MCDLSLLDERDACVWRLRMRDFDTSTRGGAALNADLRELVARYASSDPSVTDAVTLECASRTPRTRTNLRSLRVVSPRALVHRPRDAGGSVCVEILAPHAWRPETSVASVWKHLSTRS